MRDSLKTLAAGLACMIAAPLAAESAEFDSGGGRASELEPYIQCAPYAREVSGIRIYGDARTWWSQAQGRYATGDEPQVGAVMAFRPYRGMVFGHVATVSRLIDSRSVLLDHANWSPIDGRRGQVEKNVLAVDVSPANDWSAVRVWYAPLDGLGTTAWPVEGFIYADKARVAPPVQVARTEPSKEFLKAFAAFR